jgi:serine/threonine-protein kinase
MDDLVREGDVLVEKYRVERVLGQGGMGVVVAALHLQLEQHVALKFLLPGAAAVPEAVARFLREARAAARIQSDHVVRVTDVGTLDSGAPYMVMELLHGMDLSQVVRTTGPIAVTQAVDYMLQACEGVAEAHKFGIVHRDLKPSNLFLTRKSDGSPLIKVLDFGISKTTSVTGAGPLTLTATTAIMGSPLYMSPEQVRSAKDVDARTDIWSLGIVLYEFLSGAPVFNGDSASAVMAMIVADPPPPIRAVRPDVPAEVEAVILRCLEKDRTRRYANLGELAVAIAPFASPRGRASAEHVARIFQVATDATATASPALFPAMGAPLPTGASWGNTAPSSPPRRAKAVLLGALGGAAIAVAVGALVMRRTAEPSRGAAEPTPAAGESAAAPTTSATTPTASTTTPVTSAPAPIASAETATSVVDAGTSVTPARVEASPTHSKKIVTPPPAPPPVRQKAPDNVFDNRTF